MAITVTDGGRQIIASGTWSANVKLGPRCNMKIVDAWWQDTGAVDTNVLTFQDEVGRVFTYTASTDGVPIAIGKLDWLEGPITITAMTQGTVYFILGNK